MKIIDNVKKVLIFIVGGIIGFFLGVLFFLSQEEKAPFSYIEEDTIDPADKENNPAVRSKHEKIDISD